MGKFNGIFETKLLRCLSILHPVKISVTLKLYSLHYLKFAIRR